MPEGSASTLQHLWHGGRDGYLCPLEQVRAWAYREALVALGAPTYGLHLQIACKVWKIGRGKWNGGGHPSPNAVRELVEKTYADRVEKIASSAT